MINKKSIPSILSEVFQQTLDESILLIDARSPGEFEHAHIPSAVNIPLLDNAQREQVGICYKKLGKQAAIDLGFELAAPFFLEKIKLARTLAGDRPVAVYCARGGLRSEILTWLLLKGGLSAVRLTGGYKTWRNACLDQFRAPRHWVVLTGLTGVGKTEILHTIRARGEAVLDLEALAHHKGSAFGGLGQPNQPTQEHFENGVAVELMGWGEQPRYWMEDESRFIGKLRIPDDLFLYKLNAQRIVAERSFGSRIDRVLLEYGQLPTADLMAKTASLEKRLGNELMRQAIAFLESGDMREWALIMLNYYDRLYAHGLDQNASTWLGKVNADIGAPAEVADQIIQMAAHGK